MFYEIYLGKSFIPTEEEQDYFNNRIGAIFKITKFDARKEKNFNALSMYWRRVMKNYARITKDSRKYELPEDIYLGKHFEKKRGFLQQYGE